MPPQFNGQPAPPQFNGGQFALPQFNGQMPPFFNGQAALPPNYNPGNVPGQAPPPFPNFPFGLDFNQWLYHAMGERAPPQWPNGQ